MGPSSKTKGKIRLGDVLNVLKPLLLLIIPILLLLIVHFFIVERWVEIAKWIRYFAYFISAIIGLWVVIRAAVYSRGLFALWRQDREIMRQDPLFVVETKMRARIKRAHKQIRQTNHSPYDLPFFSVIGKNDTDINTVLAGSGVVFPLDLNPPMNEDLSGYENWHIGNEAVFVDVSALLSKKKEQEWKLFLKTLSKARPAAPINGAIIVLPVDHFLSSNSKKRAAFEVSMQETLQLMQEKLQEKFPVYLIISGINQMSGFEEFFKSLPESERVQILGYSNPDSFFEKLDLEALFESFEDIRHKLNLLMLRRMEEEREVPNIDRLYLFNTKLGALLESAKETIGRVFGPDKYLDPIPFRGCYFTGGAFSKPAFDSSDAQIGLQTVVGDGSNMNVDASTIIGDGVNIQNAQNLSLNWFCSDFFLTKLIPEGGNISRPKWAKKSQKILKYTALATFIAELIVVSTLVISEARDTSDWREESSNIIQRAQYLLTYPTAVGEGDKDPKSILNDIVRIQEQLKKEKLFKGATSLGLQGDLSKNLRSFHSALFNKFFLGDLITETEQSISSWDGNGRDFKPFATRLIEYVRWANPSYEGTLEIESFLDWEKDVQSVNYRNFLLKHFVVNQKKAIPKMTDNRALSRIKKALEKINGTSPIVIPLESGEIDRNPGESEWEWWQRLFRSLSTYSNIFEKLTMVRPPVLNDPNNDPNNQIYEIIRLVAQLMNSVLQLDNLIDQGQKKHHTWMSSFRDFFPELKKSAANWQPVIQLIDKSEIRSDHAFEQIVKNSLIKEMHWIQSFIGSSGGQLASALDNIVDTKTKVSKREVKTNRNIGIKVLTFIKAFSDYLAGVEKLIKKSGALVSYSTFYNGEELVRKLNALGEELKQLSALERKLNNSVAVINIIADEVQKQDNSSQDRTNEDKVKMGAKGLAKEAAKSLYDGISIKKDVLSRFRWTQMSTWIKNWQVGLQREKAYLASLYWMELFDWYKPFRKDNLKRSWGSMLRMDPFPQKNSKSFVEGTEKFLEEWIASIPTEIKSLLDKEEEAEAAGIKDFILLYDQVKKFQSNYLSGLRQAAFAFVNAVHVMDPVAYKSWRALMDGSEPELTWAALEAFSRFKNTYETTEGVALRNITGSLQEVEVAIVKTFEGQLRREFDAQWLKIITKMKRDSTTVKFPFVRNGPSAGQNEVIQILTNMVALGESFGIVNTSTEEAVDFPTRSAKMLDRVISSSRRRFIQRCSVFKRFLGGGGDQMPELEAEMASGDIGKHYHWIRMFVGRRNYFDMSVYGNKKTKIDLATNHGGVKLIGLDVEKTMLAEQTITQGELGLLQMTYTNGRSIGKDRKNWRISGQLGTASADGQQISFAMIFSFNQSLPKLPILPD